MEGRKLELPQVNDRCNEEGSDGRGTKGIYSKDTRDMTWTQKGLTWSIGCGELGRGKS